MAEITFPDGFLWGAATSSYQIEGAVAVDGRRPSIWDTFSHTPGRIAGGDTGDVAADHYRRMTEDVALMRDLGLQAYRFSIAWPRVIPEGDGAVNQRGLDFYRRLVDELRAVEIEPFVTLYHWDLPQPLQDRGGWLDRGTVAAFGRYAETVFAALRDGVEWWATHNEPWVSAYMGHYAGIFAPGLADLQAAVTAHHHLLLSHGVAVRAMRAIDPGPRQGIVLNMEPALAMDDDPVLIDAARRVEGLLDRSFGDPIFAGRYPMDVIADLHPARFPVEDDDLDVIATPLDWLGLNYYRIQFLERSTPGRSMAATWPGCDLVGSATAGRPVTDMGWPVAPEGLTQLLQWLADRYPELPPIVITENGCAYDDEMSADGRVHDPRRIAYYDGHLRAVHRAIESGVDVRGYMAWSLMDNFEWASGYAKRFGLVHVNYETQERTLRDSARWYSSVIGRNGLV